MLILAGGFFDLVDGVVARHHGIATRFGAFLDSTLDRWADVVLLVGDQRPLRARGRAASTSRSRGSRSPRRVLVSYAKARAELVLEHFEVGLLERAERVVILAAGALFGLLVPALWIIAIGSAITAGQRIALAYREMQRLDAAEAQTWRRAHDRRRRDDRRTPSRATTSARAAGHRLLDARALARDLGDGAHGPRARARDGRARAEKNLALAHQTIDTLEMLQEKTRGNLDATRRRSCSRASSTSCA